MSSFPESINVVNPYKKYPQKVPTEGFEELLFKLDDAEEIIQSFHTHPAFSVALSNLSSLRESQLDYEQTISRLNGEIVEAGPGVTSSWVSAYEEAVRVDYPSVEMFGHIGALISLYDSLATLDQFIYQGLFGDELIEFNRSHIIDVMWTIGGAGPSMWLMHIPLRIMYLLTNLIIVNIDSPGEKSGLGDTLCRIETQVLPGSMMTPGILKLRMIDDDLNAYRYL